MGFPPNVSMLCHVEGGALMGAPNAGNYSNPFIRISSWFYNGLSDIPSQLVSRDLTEVLCSIYYSQLSISVGKKNTIVSKFSHLAEVTIFCFKPGVDSLVFSPSCTKSLITLFSML